jgi:diketogulonate reductase-like aldo/keto reductase
MTTVSSDPVSSTPEIEQWSVKAIRKFLKECGLDYIHLCLARSPLGGTDSRELGSHCGSPEGGQGEEHRDKQTFGIRRKEELLPVGKGFSDPTVHQVRPNLRLDLYAIHLTREACRSPSVYDADGHVEYCLRRGILLEAWAPLVEAMRFNHPP